MIDAHPVDIRGLHRSYGKSQVLRGLDLQVRHGQCHGFFGRNGAGKTTTLKCLLNHLRPDQGQVEVFGLDPATDEVAVKARVAYLPDEPAFYPWMTIRRTLDYLASFRRHWNRDLERELLSERFGLDPKLRCDQLSKGMRAQLALVTALCPEPELLILDEPTSGLDPVVRRELLETVIGKFQRSTSHNPGSGLRTLLVSTHLIADFEGLLDAFTILHGGTDLVSLAVDEAYRRFKKVWLQFDDQPPPLAEPQVLSEERSGRNVQLTVRDYSPELEARLRARNPLAFETSELTLEEIFIACTAGKN